MNDPLDLLDHFDMLGFAWKALSISVITYDIIRFGRKFLVTQDYQKQQFFSGSVQFFNLESSLIKDHHCLNTFPKICDE